MWGKKKSDFDLIMDRNKAKDIVNTQGWEGFFNYMNQQYEQYNFYSCSQEWYEEDEDPFICKFRGGNGDVIIGWKGVHDK